MPETTWVDGDIATAAKLNQIEDQIIVTCTSTTRPTGTEGRVIYETDTGIMRVYDGSVFRIMGGSTWNDYTPSFTNLPTSSTDGAWRYTDGGVWIVGNGTASGAATGTISTTLPSSLQKRNDGVYALGVARYVDNTSTNATGQLYVPPNSTTMTFTDVNGAPLSASVPFTWATADIIRFQIFVPL